jgi:anti-sigma B factor antagonist
MASVMGRHQQQPKSVELMTTRVDQADRSVVVHVAGEIDYVSAEVLRERVTGAAATAGSWRLVLDLGDVEYCDSSGLAVLVGLWKAARAEGGKLVLASVPGSCSRLLRRTGLGGVADAYGTVAEAVAACAKT